MRQIIQDLKSGETILEEVSSPIVKPGYVVVQTTRSLVSLGTEKMLVEFGKAGLIAKARQQPEKVKMVIDKMKTDGILPTLEAVFNKLNQPLPLGYCNVGKVVEIGPGVKNLKVGDRVASNGNHAEFVCVPENLAARIPDNVSDDEATFTVIGSIALQGIRLLGPTFGETVAVIGLGLIGLITAELLIANGCRVIGIDIDADKLNLAQKLGVFPLNSAKSDTAKSALSITNETGVDGVIITASSSSNEIMAQSARMCRKHGQIILIGVVGLNINRSDFYEKEIRFQVSCSYGPGRYDQNYEEKGNDYPIGYVRWTEKRNFEAILNAISTKRLNVSDLITERIPLNEYKRIYGEIGKRNTIASILEYSEETEYRTSVTVRERNIVASNGTLGIIGAGNFTSAMILPCLKKLKADIKWISSAGGLTGKNLSKRFGINKVTSNYKEILEDPEVDAVLITTRHNLHAQMIIDALKENKNVFVEKPLALNQEELKAIKSAYELSDKSLSMGFNRRVAPLSVKVKELLGEDNAPVNIVATMNAGFIPPNSWVHDMVVGGGRIIGEACHYIDLCSFFAGSHVTRVCANSFGVSPEENSDNMSILLKYENGSNAVINYFSNGSKQYPKERIEVFKQEKVLVIDNWRKLNGYGLKRFKKLKSSQDKGHLNQFRKLLDLLKSGGTPMIPMNSIINTTRASFAAVESMKKNAWIDIIK